MVPIARRSKVVLTGPRLRLENRYALTAAVGFIFCLFMILITWCLKRYNAEKQTSEQFTTAGHTLKSGIIASSVVSTWTWAATLLQSSSIAYR